MHLVLVELSHHNFQTSEDTQYWWYPVQRSTLTFHILEFRPNWASHEQSRPVALWGRGAFDI